VTKHGPKIKSSSLKLLVLLLPLAAIAEDLCDWKSKTKPPSLQGHEGNSVSDMYWFAHTTDVDETANKRRFIFAIRNLHPQRLLPAEWLRSDGQIQVAFSRIAPGKCGSNDFETSNSYGEDSKAMIKYGPTLQLTKASAPLYVEAGQPTPAPRNATPNLKSCLKADLQSASGKIETVHLEFGTQTEGTAFMYTVVNRGSEPARFQIPALTNAWNGLAATAQFTTASKWKVVDDAFSADANNQPMRYVVNAAEATGSTEVQVPVNVISIAGETIAVGRVTVYLPIR
jgi:hypothetical protein